MRRRLQLARPALATVCAAVMVALLLAGALLWYLPALTARRQPLAGVPAPPALFSAARYPLAAHQQACEPSVAVTPQSQLADFQLFPNPHPKHGGPPVRFTLTAPGYHAVAMVPGGYPGGTATLNISPPPHPLIATACFDDVGSASVQLVGTNEARTVSRSAPVTIDGRAVPGDVSLAFYEKQPVGIVHRLGQFFAHASNLTDGLVPPALIWMVALVTGFGVPLAMILALWLAVRGQPPSP